MKCEFCGKETENIELLCKDNNLVETPACVGCYEEFKGAVRL